MISLPTLRIVLVGVLLPLALACQGEVDDAGRNIPTSLQPGPLLPIFELGEPVQEIGEFEGGGDQTLDLVADVELLPGGRIAVADQNAAVVLVYDTLGELIGTVGGRGDGPGEFRSPIHVRLAEGDSLQVLDGRDNRVSVFGPDLEYAREVAASEVSGSDAPVYSHHFVDRFWVAGPVTPASRTAAELVLSAVPYPPSRGGFRFVQATEDGRYWVRETAVPDDEGHLWIVLDTSGTPMTAVRTPERFAPIFIRGDEVWGRWRGEFDVNYVRRYRISESARRIQLPPWMGGMDDRPVAPPMPDSVVRSLMALIRNAATIQEIHYADAQAYSPDLGGLLTDQGFELPENLHLDVLHANDAGWGTVMTVEGHSGLCALTYGRGAPPGFPGGRVVCGR